jgi:hypothetical protein
MAALARMIGRQYRLGGRRGAWDPREAHGGGVTTVPWLDAAVVDVVPMAEGNGSGRGGPVAVAVDTRVGMLWAVGAELVEVAAMPDGNRSGLPSGRRSWWKKRRAGWLPGGLVGRFSWPGRTVEVGCHV